MTKNYKSIKIGEICNLLEEKIQLCEALQEVYLLNKQSGKKGGKNYTTELKALKCAFCYMAYLTRIINNNSTVENWKDGNLGVIFEQVLRLYFSADPKKCRHIRLAKSKDYDAIINGEQIEIKCYIKTPPHSWTEEGIKTSKKVLVYVANDNCFYYLNTSDLKEVCSFSGSKGYTLTLNGIRKYGTKAELHK